MGRGCLLTALSCPVTVGWLPLVQLSSILLFSPGSSTVFVAVSFRLSATDGSAKIHVTVFPRLLTNLNKKKAMVQVEIFQIFFHVECFSFSVLNVSVWITFFSGKKKNQYFHLFNSMLYLG